MAKEKKVVNVKNKEKVDNVLSYVIVKKLVTPIIKTKAYQLGLVDRDGKSVKEPKTEEERMAYSLFDKLIFKIKRLLGSRLAQLNAFLFLQTLEDDFYDNMIVTGALSRKAAITRVKKDMEKLMERYDISYEQFFKELAHKECEIVDNDKV